MATATSTFDGDMSVTANFNALMGWIDSNLQSFGWTYTSQTGDGDPSSVSAPAAGSFACFRCYASADAGTTYYVRIDFGRRSGQNGPMLKVQVGSSVNGSGTLGGQTSTAKTTSTAQSAGSNFRSYMSGDSARFMMLINAGDNNLSSGYTVGWSVGRTVDTSGAVNNTGIEVFHTSCNGDDTGWYEQFVPFSGTVPTEETLDWPSNMSARNPATVGSSVLFGIPQTFGENGGNNPTLCVAITDPSTLTVATTTTLMLYGTSHTYLVAGHVQARAGANCRPLLRYE